MIAGDLHSASLVNVEDEPLGSVATAAAGIGATFLLLEDLNDFDFDGGTLKTPAGQIVGFTIPADLSRVNLDVPLTAAVAVGDFIAVDPPAYESFGWILPPNASEPIPARIPIALRTVLRSGVRDIAAAEDVRYGVDPDPASNDLVLGEVRGELPSVDASFVDTTSAQPSDGHPPASSPTPSVLGGPTFLSVTWPDVANADPVTYEVHVSTTTGFVPGPSTKYAELRGTGIIVKTLPGGVALVYGTTYYVKLIAKDFDGAAAAGVQGSGSMAQINTPDLAANAVTANQIAALAVTAGKINVSQLSAISADMGSITAGIVTGATFRTSAVDPKLQMDATGLFATDAAGVKDTIFDNSGMRLLEGTEAWPAIPVAKTIRWFNGANDVGALYAYLSGSVRLTRLEALGRSALGDLGAGASLEARKATEGVGAGTNIQVIRDLTGAGSNQIYVAVAGSQKLLLSDGNISDYVLPVVQNTYTAKQTFHSGGDNVSVDVLRGVDVLMTAPIQRWMNAAGSSVLAQISTYGRGIFNNAGITTIINAGAVSDGVFPGSDASSGTIALDTSNKRLYARVGTAWNFVPLATAAPPAYTLGAFTSRRTIANTDTLANVANTLATLISDLQTRGMLA